jgi:hypothetical protein
MTKLIRWLLWLGTATAVLAQGPQQGQLVRSNPFIGTEVPTQLFFYDGSGNLQYICSAQPQQSGQHQTTFAISNTTLTPTNATGNILALTNVVVSSTTATATTVANHGLQVGNQIVVTDPQTPALAGTYYIQTVGSSTTFTFTVSGVTGGTYTDAGLTIFTNAPRSSDSVWAIQKFTYNGSNQVTNSQSNIGAGSFTATCNNKAVTTGSTAIEYQ